MSAEHPLNCPRFLLRLLGPPQIEGPDGMLEGGAVQRHRLALLGLLAATPRGLLSRDRLMGQLWPEASAENARNLLNAAVHAVRRAMGEEVLISQGASLQLDGSTLRIDVVEFEDAVARGESGRAIELYTGPFLDGLSLPGAVEFEHWLDQQRDRLERLFNAVLEQQAETLARLQGPASAVPVWRRRLACSPLEGRVVVELMKALDGSGDRAGALQVAAVHKSLLRSELGIPPDAEVDAFATRLRMSPTQPRGTRVAETAGPAIGNGHSSGPPADDHDLDQTGPAVKLAGNSTSSEDRRRQDSQPDETTRGRLKFVRLIPLAAGLLILVGWLILQRVREDSALPLVAGEATTSAAVFPFKVYGSAELEWMGEGLMDMLSEAIDGAGDLRRVDPRAIMSRVRRDDLRDVTIEDARRITRELGGAHFILANVTGVADEIRLAAQVYDSESNAPRASYSVTGTPTELVNLLTDLARHLLGSLPLGSGARLDSIRTINTTNLEALKAYLQGETLLRRSDFFAAEKKLTEAVRLDSAFALAWLRLAFTQGWTYGDAAASVERAMRHADRLSPRDLLHARGHYAFFSGAADTAEWYAANTTGQYRNDAEAWANLAGVNLFFGWRHGRTFDPIRDALQKALELDPSHHQARYHTVWLAMMERRYADVEAVLRDQPQPVPGGAFDPAARALVAYTLGDSSARAATEKSFELSSDWMLWNAAAILASFTDSLDTARRLWQRLANDPTRSEVGRATAQGYLATLAVSRGRFREAVTEFAKFASQRQVPAIAYFAWFVAAPVFDRPQEELRAIRDSLRGWVVPPPDSRDMLWRSLNVPQSLHPWIKDYLVGLLSARLRDSADALQRADALLDAREPADPEDLRTDLAREIRALVAFQSRRFADALEIVEQSTYGLTSHAQVFSHGFYRRPISRLIRAAALDELGRSEEALGWYLWFSNSEWSTDMAFIGAARFLMAGIHDRNGEHEMAAKNYRCFVARWRNSDPEYERLMSDAQSRLAELDPNGRQMC